MSEKKQTNILTMPKEKRSEMLKDALKNPNTLLGLLMSQDSDALERFAASFGFSETEARVIMTSMLQTGAVEREGSNVRTK